MWFPTRSDINRAVQAQKQARSLKFQTKEEEELYYPGSENKGADQLRGYRGFVFAYADCWFSHEAAHLLPVCKRSLMRCINKNCTIWPTFSL